LSDDLQRWDKKDVCIYAYAGTVWPTAITFSTLTNVGGLFIGDLPRCPSQQGVAPAFLKFLEPQHMPTWYDRATKSYKVTELRGG